MRVLRLQDRDKSPLSPTYVLIQYVFPMMHLPWQGTLSESVMERVMFRIHHENMPTRILRRMHLKLSAPLILIFHRIPFTIRCQMINTVFISLSGTGSYLPRCHLPR